MKKLIKQKRLDRKGFTLIEIIVVIVILAILMSIAVPSVLKYVDEANDAQYYAKARSIYQEMEIELTKLAVASGDRIRIGDAKKLENDIKNRLNDEETDKRFQLYGIKISSNEEPAGFDDSWITKDDRSVDETFSLSEVKSYLLAYTQVGHGYTSYHVLIMPNNRIEIKKNK